MTTKEIAAVAGVERPAVIQWAKKHNLKKQLGKNGVMEYVFSETDLQNFLSRPAPGRPAEKKKQV